MHCPLVVSGFNLILNERGNCGSGLGWMGYLYGKHMLWLALWHRAHTYGPYPCKAPIGTSFFVYCAAPNQKRWWLRCYDIVKWLRMCKN